MSFANNTSTDTEKLYTTSEAAEFFSVTPQTIRRWVKKGIFPNVKQVNFLERRIPFSDMEKIKTQFEQSIF